MGTSAVASPLIEKAAHLVAYWEDLRTTEPHELRAHLTLGRMCVAFYEAIGMTEDWSLRTDFEFWPIRKEPLSLVLLVGRVDGQLRATMREGAEHDMKEHYSPAQLRKQLERGDYGILGSWAPWVNAYFLNAIRDALFGLLHSRVVGAAWKFAERHPAGDVVRDARAAIEDAEEHVPAFGPMPSPILQGMESKLVGKASHRARMIWRRLRQLDVRIPPQNIPLDRLRGRSPPPGMPRKGNALTLTEQLVLYLREELHLGNVATAQALEMQDWRQVRDARDAAHEKREKWRRFTQKRAGKSR